jgi:hypothetical protein
MNEMCDRCGPAVAAVYRARRHGELYLCGHCADRLWAALFAQGWTIGPAGGHAVSLGRLTSAPAPRGSAPGVGAGQAEVPGRSGAAFGAFVRWCRRAGAGDHGAWPSAADPRKQS